VYWRVLTCRIHIPALPPIIRKHYTIDKVKPTRTHHHYHHHHCSLSLLPIVLIVLITHNKCLMYICQHVCAPIMCAYRSCVCVPIMCVCVPIMCAYRSCVYDQASLRTDHMCVRTDHMCVRTHLPKGLGPKEYMLLNYSSTDNMRYSHLQVLCSAASQPQVLNKICLKLLPTIVPSVATHVYLIIYIIMVLIITYTTIYVYTLCTKI
jgi:hypothetical protein